MVEPATSTSSLPAYTAAITNALISVLLAPSTLFSVALTVTTNYLVPVKKSGLVVFIGEKENYGNVIIIQQMDGIDLWYGNLKETNVKLYDYVEEGTLLGEVKENTLYLVFKKEGNVLNYQEYIK